MVSMPKYQYLYELDIQRIALSVSDVIHSSPNRRAQMSAIDPENLSLEENLLDLNMKDEFLDVISGLSPWH